MEWQQANSEKGPHVFSVELSGIGRDVGGTDIGSTVQLYRCPADVTAYIDMMLLASEGGLLSLCLFDTDVKNGQIRLWEGGAGNMFYQLNPAVAAGSASHSESDANGVSYRMLEVNGTVHDRVFRMYPNQVLGFYSTGTCSAGKIRFKVTEESI